MACAHILSLVPSISLASGHGLPAPVGGVHHLPHLLQEMVVCSDYTMLHNIPQACTYLPLSNWLVVKLERDTKSVLHRLPLQPSSVLCRFTHPTLHAGPTACKLCYFTSSCY